jgi:TolB-like protein
LNNHSHNLIRNTLLMISALLIFCSISPALAAPARVAILPFDMHAEKDLTFLQEGIMDMLGSRIAYQDQVEVISKSETRAALESVKGFQGESRALLIGAKLKADYVLFGSITMFGESVSIDAKMVDVTSQKPPLPFFAQTRGMADVIPQINQFATDINATVFGRAAAQQPVAVPAPQAGTMPATQVQPAPPAYDPRMHPEKLLQSGVQNKARVPVAGQPYQAPNPGFVTAAPAYGANGNHNFWKSKNFKSVISTMDIGDVDNDGALETVLAEDDNLVVYRNIKGRMMKTAEISDKRTGHYLGIDVGDINGNGTPEIFVSSISLQRDRYNSFVLEFNGSEYKRIVDNSPWLYRIAHTSTGRSVLLGQRSPKVEADLFSTPIFEMFWKNGEYASEKQLIGGRRANVLGVAYDDVLQEGQDKLVAFSTGDRIRIYNNNGESAWNGDDKHGGSLAYFNLPSKDTTDKFNIQYFPMRIRTADIDGDGKVEIISASNKDIIGILERFRQLNKGYLLSLSWNGMGLAQNWKTQEMEGRISDFAIGDFDNDGAEELVATIVSKEGSFALTEKKSFILSFDLNVPTP